MPSKRIYGELQFKLTVTGKFQFSVDSLNVLMIDFCQTPEVSGLRMLRFDARPLVQADAKTSGPYAGV